MEERNSFVRYVNEEKVTKKRAKINRDISLPLWLYLIYLISQYYSRVRFTVDSYSKSEVFSLRFSYSNQEKSLSVMRDSVIRNEIRNLSY